MQESAAIAGHCMGPSWVVVDQFGCEGPQKGKESNHSNESEQEGEDAIEEEEELELLLLEDDEEWDEAAARAEMIAASKARCMRG